MSRPQGMETILGILIPLTFVACIVLERLFPARVLPKVRFWLLKGFVFFAMSGVVNAILPALVTRAMAGHAPLDLSGLGTWGGAAVGVLASEVAYYALHRAMHRSRLLWLWTHQLHHSAERIDAPSAAFLHPLDIILQVGVTTAAVVALGVTPDAAALAGFVMFLFAMFQHLNVRTPRWLGYVMQRPEGHTIHHARGIHAYNYGNLSVLDLLFGTFRNPAVADEEVGFYPGASARTFDMLVGRDVSEPPVPARPALGNTRSMPRHA